MHGNCDVEPEEDSEDRDGLEIDKVMGRRQTRFVRLLSRCYLHNQKISCAIPGGEWKQCVPIFV